MNPIHYFDSRFSVKIYPAEGINQHVSFYCMIDGEPIPPKDLTIKQMSTLKEYLKTNYPLHYNLTKGWKA